MTLSRILGYQGVLLGTLAVPSAQCQDNVLDLRLVELNDHGERTYHNFIYARTLHKGQFMVEAYHLRLPPDHYTETSLGLGYRLWTRGSAAVYGLGHFAWASDDQYFQPAMFLVAPGKLGANVYVMYYAPLGRSGVTQWLVDPVEVQYRVWDRLSLGLSGYYWRPHGGPSLVKKGGLLSISLGQVTLVVAVRAVNLGGGVETQLRSIVVF
jgi:hypothetical protein